MGCQEISNVAALSCKLKALLNHPHRQKTIKANTKGLGRPRAAFDVAVAAAGMTGVGVGSVEPETQHISLDIFPGTSLFQHFSIGRAAFHYPTRTLSGEKRRMLCAVQAGRLGLP